MAELNVIVPGLSTTVQDAGRVGYQRQGVPVSGAIDRVALAAANTVVGNPPAAAALEMLYQGATLEAASGRARIAAAGAGVVLEITRREGGVEKVAGLTSATLESGDRVRVVMPGPGIAAYLAVAGGVDVPAVMGSRSTYVRAGIGGYQGRALKAGDRVALTAASAGDGPERMLSGVDLAPARTARIVPGPQDDYFTVEALAVMTSALYRVAPASDRMGLRLDGPKLPHAKGYNIVSDGIAPGAIQVPGDGLPIVLMADRQTTGGYPKIATIASADLPAVGRLGPGSMLGFRLVTLAEAEELRRAQAAEIASWRSRVREAGGGGVIDEARLAAENLISGAVDAIEPRHHHD